MLYERGIRFCAVERLLNRNGKIVGMVLVFDTRPREMSDQEKELLHAAGTAAVEALEVRAIAPSTKKDAEPTVQEI